LSCDGERKADEKLDTDGLLASSPTCPTAVLVFDAFVVLGGSDLGDPYAWFE
jgi:hypothetical protein